MTDIGFVRANRARLSALLLRVGLLAWLLGWAFETFAAPPIPPAPIEMITDEAGVMSSAARASLERRLEAYEAEAHHQIIVWIDRTSGGLDIESFAAQAFAAWKVGRKQLDDGVAIFVMVEDRTVRIEVGYGLESVLTDLAASEVIRTRMLPAIRRGDWDAAIDGGVEGVVDTIEGKADALPADPASAAPVSTQPPAVATTPTWWPIAKIVGVVLLGLALLILLITHPRLAILSLLVLGRGRGGGGSGFRGGGGRSGGGGASGRW